MKNNLILASFVTFLLTLVAFAGTTSASDSDAARAYLDKTGQAAIASITSQKGDAEKSAELEKLFRANVDTKWMANFVIGRYIRETSAEQKNKYFSLYEKYLINSYVPKFKQYTGQSFKIDSVTEVGTDEYIAKTTIKSTKSATGDIFVDYRIIKSGGTFKIVDIIGEGVSLITTQRSDFGGLISQKGFDYFLTKLEEKVSKQQAAGGVNAQSVEGNPADKN